MKTNRSTKSSSYQVSNPAPLTHEGAKARRITPYMSLRRSVLAAMLFEDQFYESGETIAKRISDLVSTVSAQKVADLAVEARVEQKLRHMPLFLAREMLKNPSHKPLVADVLERIIQRPDELSEMLALYWKDGKKPLAAQLKKGLARAFTKFDEYSLSKWDKKDAEITLRDTLFLCHAKPKDDEQAGLWKRLVNKELRMPENTWEVQLSACKVPEEKKVVWTNLLKNNELGGLAFLRNLRNMEQVGVDRTLIRDAFDTVNFSRVLPFRFIAAAKYAPHLESELEATMFKAAGLEEKIKGKTVIMLDTSESMSSQVSSKSDLTRLDAAAALAILAREICEEVEIYTFNNDVKTVPNRRGFALRDAIGSARGGTDTGNAVNYVNGLASKWDRLIVFTDEQSHTAVPNPKNRGYMVNVASAKNGVGYGPWIHVDGFSEAIVKYIQEYERLENTDDLE